jgi:hypothetical protein
MNDHRPLQKTRRSSFFSKKRDLKTLQKKDLDNCGENAERMSPSQSHTIHTYKQKVHMQEYAGSPTIARL